MSISLHRLENDIRKKVSLDVHLREWHSSIMLEGTVSTWDGLIIAGKMCTKRGYKGVVNRIRVNNLEIPEMRKPRLCDNFLNGKKFDVLIIGGGITGSAIARELSKWKLTILLVDKEEDLAMHASSRNDGMIHPGIESKIGSKRAIFNVRGNEMYTRISEELNVPIIRCGSSILYDNKWLAMAKPVLNIRAKKMGVIGARFLSADEVLKREPNIAVPIAGAIHFDTTGVTSPYKMTVAYAENAVENGAEVSLNTVVLSIKKNNEKIIGVETNRGTVIPKVVINAAGVFADKIADMVDDQFFSIHPRKGEIIFLDKKKGRLINGVIAKPSLALTSGNTKGGGIVKTVDGNVLIGPDAYEQPFTEDFTTNMNNINALMKKHFPIIKGLSPADVITYCAGIRAATYEEDFVIERSECVGNLVYAAGIQSPGFASAPAIAEEIEKIACKVLSEVMEVKAKENWKPRRKAIPDLSKMDYETRSKIIKENPSYGEIVCRCEGTSKGEIIDAINSLVPVYTVDGIKRRVRAGMGRCQGGFCLPTVMNILCDETGLPMTAITKKGNISNILVEETKNSAAYEVNINEEI
ncbi:NAD(P)/FAD-dependent oxidoreductase [Clostridium estertheticum]|uniref:NAD(P)/FAD-dependent oxidoreductase n=1 Tax=Clostridium estertheticum TaxID=238834 RepID=UPI0013E98AC8|nr:NAD(P)/FAD-dependent oxidoreductase [Clostridium estertheticum]MBZ9687019.1 NAD(P)/FAD-dependent oxidoreductase [Clostridium estertheticum]